MDTRKELLEDLTQRLLELGNSFNFSNLKVETECQSSNIYLLNGAKYSLQLEIEWRECDCFLYVVQLDNGKIPLDFYYKKSNGEWCRKYVEDIYEIKNPVYKENTNLKNTSDFIKCKFDFYFQLLQRNPQPINRVLEI